MKARTASRAPDRVLVTGAASGLGRAIAERYAAAGSAVAVTDIDADAGQRIAEQLGERAVFRPLDVTDDAAWRDVADWCRHAWGGLDVLVNNAGVAAAGRFERIAVEDWQWIIDINLLGVVRGCRAFVPMFKEAGSGQLVNIASLAALTNLPAMSSYNVSKSAVVALSQTLRHELAPFGIGTTVVCPGFVQTNLGASLRSPDPEAERVMFRLLGAATVTPAEVAQQTYDAACADEFLVLTHRDGRRFARMQRFAPWLADRARVAFWRRLRAKFEKGDR